MASRGRACGAIVTTVDDWRLHVDDAGDGSTDTAGQDPDDDGGGGGGGTCDESSSVLSIWASALVSISRTKASGRHALEITRETRDCTASSHALHQLSMHPALQPSSLPATSDVPAPHDHPALALTVCCETYLGAIGASGFALSICASGSDPISLAPRSHAICDVK